MMINETISNTQTPSSYASIAVWTLCAGTLAYGLVYGMQGVDVAYPIFRYSSRMDASSYDSYTNLLQDRTVSDVSMEEIIGAFYAKLLQSKEDLGSDFNTVYFKNIRKLYDN